MAQQQMALMLMQQQQQMAQAQAQAQQAAGLDGGQGGSAPPFDYLSGQGPPSPLYHPNKNMTLFGQQQPSSMTIPSAFGFPSASFAAVAGGGGGGGALSNAPAAVQFASPAERNAVDSATYSAVRAAFGTAFESMVSVFALVTLPLSLSLSLCTLSMCVCVCVSALN